MPVVICLLRGVNVGGHNKIKMDALRALFESLKLREAQTYVQSGNIVFRTEEQNLADLSTRIELAFAKTFGFRSSVILRTASEWRDVVSANPFATRRDIEPAKLLVTFLASEPAPEARNNLLQLRKDPEELRLH